LAPLTCPKQGLPSPEYGQAYLDEYRQIRPLVDIDDRTVLRYRDGMTKADFEERKSKLKRVLTAALGPGGARPYLIDSIGRRPMRYGLGLAAQTIRFGEIA
jgi:hypothetical protein